MDLCNSIFDVVMDRSIFVLEGDMGFNGKGIVQARSQGAICRTVQFKEMHSPISFDCNSAVVFYLGALRGCLQKLSLGVRR